LLGHAQSSIAAPLNGAVDLREGQPGLLGELLGCDTFRVVLDRARDLASPQFLDLEAALKVLATQDLQVIKGAGEERASPVLSGVLVIEVGGIQHPVRER
jgi:hypothetical protein